MFGVTALISRSLISSSLVPILLDFFPLAINFKTPNILSYKIFGDSLAENTDLNFKIICNLHYVSF